VRRDVAGGLVERGSGHRGRGPHDVRGRAVEGRGSGAWLDEDGDVGADHTGMGEDGGIAGHTTFVI
jgi:hypothetical protein